MGLPRNLQRQIKVNQEGDRARAKDTPDRGILKGGTRVPPNGAQAPEETSRGSLGANTDRRLGPFRTNLKAGRAAAKRSPDQRFSNHLQGVL